MLDNKGFAVSSVLYTLLIAFLLFLGAALAQFSSSSSLIGKANDDIINGNDFNVTQVRASAVDKTCGRDFYWYQDSSGNTSNIIVKVKSRYGTKYWPKDFRNAKVEVNDKKVTIIPGESSGNISVSYEIVDADYDNFGKLIFTDEKTTKKKDIILSDVCSDGNSDFQLDRTNISGVLNNADLIQIKSIVNADLTDNPLKSESYYLGMVVNGELIDIIKRNDNKYQLASTTKIMTTFVTLEQLENYCKGNEDCFNKQLAQTIKISGNMLSKIDGQLFQWYSPGSMIVDMTACGNNNANGTDISNYCLQEGTEIKDLGNLLYVFMRKSANDAGIIIADYVENLTGENFVDLMNKKASELGMNNTKFINVHGMPDKYAAEDCKSSASAINCGNYSTAQDMALLMKSVVTYMNKNSLFSKEMKNIYESFEKKGLNITGSKFNNQNMSDSKSAKSVGAANATCMRSTDGLQCDNKDTHNENTNLFPLKHSVSGIAGNSAAYYYYGKTGSSSTALATRVSYFYYNPHNIKWIQDKNSSDKLLVNYNDPYFIVVTLKAPKEDGYAKSSAYDHELLYKKAILALKDTLN